MAIEATERKVRETKIIIAEKRTEVKRTQIKNIKIAKGMGGKARKIKDSKITNDITREKMESRRRKKVP